MHIQFRIWSPGAAGEEPKVGEPFYDPLTGRFGIFNSRFTGDLADIEWGLASVAGKLGVPKDYRLTGFTSGGILSNIQLDWSQAGKLRVLDANDGDIVLMEVSATEGAVFANASSITSGLPGPRNRIVNSGLSLRRSLIPNQASISTAAAARDYPGLRGVENEVYWDNPMLLAPNWFAWKVPDSDGDITFSLDTVSIPGGLGVSASVKAAATGAPNNSGVTVYDYDYGSLRGQIIRPSVFLRGTSGHLTVIRVRSSAGGLLMEKTVTGDNTWHQTTMDALLLPDDGSSWLAFDVLHNPGLASSASNWRAAAPQITIGATPSAYEVRSAAYERSFSAAFWRELLIDYDGLSQLASNSHLLDFLPGVGVPMLDYAADDGTLMTFPSSDAARFTISRDGGGRTPVRIAAHLVPNDTEIQ